MKDNNEDIDFDFETNEVIEPVLMDRVAFRATIDTYAGPTHITHWVTIPRDVHERFIRIRYRNNESFYAEILPRTRESTTPTAETPYSYAGLIE